MSKPVLRMLLEKAQSEGVDAAKVYRAAVQVRNPKWPAAPDLSEVMPTSPNSTPVPGPNS
jgi:hypothetical protein